MSRELPPGWANSTLGHTADQIDYGFTASASSERIGPKFLRITDIQDDQVNWEHVPFCHCPDADRYSITSGDIVFARTGATTGKSFLIKDAPEASVFASYLIRLRPNTLAIPEYLSYFMRSPDYWRQIAADSKGTAQPGVNATVLRGLSIPIAPLPEQRRIVEQIEALLAKGATAKAALDAIPALLDRYRQSLLASAFRGDLTADWRSIQGESCLSGHDLLRKLNTIEGPKGRTRRAGDVDAEPACALPSDLPEHWAMATLADLGEITTGFTPPSKVEGCFGGRVPFMKPTDLDQGSEVSQAREYLSDIGLAYGRVLPANSVLVTCIGATIGKTGLARVPCATNQQINSLSPHQGLIDPDWLYWFLCSPFGQYAITRNASATTLPIINKGRLSKLRVPLPSFAEQRVIAELVKNSLRPITMIERVLKETASRHKALTQSILAKAFRGELVPQDPADEPASALLERIRAERASAGEKPRRGRKASAA